MANLLDTFESALSLHQRGDIAAAEGLYRRILAAEPGAADARHLLGVACLQSGRAAEAVEHIRAAVALRPGIADWWANLAAAQRAAGRFPDAAGSWTRALELRPGEAAWLHGLGLATAESGRLEEGLQHLSRAAALAPGNPDIRADLGTALARAGRPDAAEAALREALVLAPDHRGAGGALAALLLNRAGADLLADRPAAALQRLDAALAIGPVPPDLRAMIQTRRGTALLRLDRFAPAADAFDEAARIRPQDPAPLIGLGDAYASSGRFAEAESVLRRALELAPGSPEALNNLGNALHGEGRLSAAADIYRAVPRDSAAGYPALVNLGTVLRDLGDDAGAEEMYRAALALRPDDPVVHWQRSLARLLAGDLETGWAEYEWRWRTRQVTAPPEAGLLPAWDDGPPPRRLLVYAEQGHGDTLQFVRYVARLLDLGVEPALRVQPALVRLMRESFGEAVPVAPIGAPVDRAAWDAACPMMGLPLRLGTRTLADIPSSVPYLHPAPAEAAVWRDRISALPGLKVGLVWAGDPRRNDPRAAIMDGRRSIRLHDLAPLAGIPGTSFVSLQKGEAAAQIHQAGHGFQAVDWTDELHDFAATAALVASLDLVIGVDTAVVHLAGALGRPVWVLSRLDGCWRWLRDREDTPWYPRTRLYRQTRWADWSDPVARLTADLRRRASAADPPRE